MRDSLQMFEKTLEDYTSCKNIQNHLMDLVENLYKDLECERFTTTNLQKQIQDFVNQDVSGITSKFAALKEECSTLKNKLLAVRNDNDDLNFQLITRSQQTKKTLAEKEDELKTHYESKLREKDEQVTKKQQEVEVYKTDFKQKQQHFFNELQAMQAVRAMELDNVESEFRKQLDESNKKLKDGINTCNILRIELMSVKEQFAEYKKSSTEKISELQKRIRELSNYEPSSSLRNDVSLDDDVDISTAIDKSNKYKPLNVSCRNVFNIEEKPVNLKKVPVYRSSGKSCGNYSNYASNRLPPLIKLKDAKETTSGNKKRKLYNPDDLTYLSMDIGNE